MLQISGWWHYLYIFNILVFDWAKLLLKWVKPIFNIQKKSIWEAWPALREMIQVREKPPERVQTLTGECRVQKEHEPRQEEDSFKWWLRTTSERECQSSLHGKEEGRSLGWEQQAWCPQTRRDGEGNGEKQAGSSGVMLHGPSFLGLPVPLSRVPPPSLPWMNHAT